MEISGSIYQPRFQQLLAVKGKCLLWRFLVLLRNIQITDTINYIIPPFYSGARVVQWVRSLDLTAHTSLSPIRRGFAPGFVNYKKGCTRLTAASDKVYQLLTHGRWFSPGTPASSTTKTGRHDIAKILLKVALKHQKSINKISSVSTIVRLYSGIVSTI